MTNRILPILAVLLAPSVAASGVLDTPAARVDVDNGHSVGCVEDLTGLCLASLSGSSIGDAEVNADQQFRYVRVSADRSFLEPTPVYELLPDGSVTIRREMLEVPNAVSPLLAERVGRVRLPPPFESFVLYFNETEHGVDYVGPTVSPLNTTPTQHHHPYYYSTDGGVEYQEVGPSRDYGGGSSDDAGRFAVDVCADFEIEACVQGASAANEVARATTPNVTFGLEFHEIGAATNASAFSGSGGLARDGISAPPIAGRVPAAYPEPVRQPSPNVLPPPRSERSLNPVSPLSIPDKERNPADVPSGVRSPAEPSATTPRAKLVAVAGAFVIAALIASLFSRFHREEALLHAKRRRIVALLERHGPMSYPDLGRAMGVDRTTIDFHVRLLVKTGFVTTAKGGRMTFVMLPGQEMALNFRRGDAEAAQALLQVLRENAGKMPRQALHDAASMFSQRTRNGALGRLIEHGLVERAFEGKLEVVRLARTPQRGSLRGQRLHGA